MSTIAQFHRSTWAILIASTELFRTPLLIAAHRLLIYPAEESMFMHSLKADRFTAAYLLFTVALLMVPKTDIPETLFDEANCPTNEMVVEKAPSWEYRQSVTAFRPEVFAQPRRISVRRFLPVYADQLTDSRTFQNSSVLSSANPTPREHNSFAV
jgi:hypothetical protein